MLACAAQAEGGRRSQRQMEQPASHPQHKFPRMAARAENVQTGGSGSAEEQAVSQAGQRQKKPLSREEKQALRKQINEAGNHYSPKVN